jgi:hypothetical protein
MTTLRFSALMLFALTAALAPTLSAKEPAREKAPKKPLPGPYVHVALYSFKPDAPADIAERYAADAEKAFKKIASIRGYRVGAPAKMHTPAAYGVTPDADYAVGTILTFDDYGGLVEYGNHQVHHELKGKYRQYFGKIVAYDFETPAATVESAVAVGEPKVDE